MHKSYLKSQLDISFSILEIFHRFVKKKTLQTCKIRIKHFYCNTFTIKETFIFLSVAIVELNEIRSTPQVNQKISLRLLMSGLANSAQFWCTGLSLSVFSSIANFEKKISCLVYPQFLFLIWYWKNSTWLAQLKSLFFTV